MKLNKEIKSQFDTNGYYTSEKLFSKKETAIFEKEFDKIIKQIQLTNEDINALIEKLPIEAKNSILKVKES